MVLWRGAVKTTKQKTTEENDKEESSLIAGIICFFLFSRGLLLLFCQSVSCEIANYCLLFLNNWPFARKLTAFISNIELYKWDEFISLTIRCGAYNNVAVCFKRHCTNREERDIL